MPWPKRKLEKVEIPKAEAVSAKIFGRNSIRLLTVQEVWFQYLYDILTTPQVRHVFPHVSPFKKMNDVKCAAFGATRLLPIECSGLVVLSRLPVQKFWYRPYSVRGKLLFDGQFAVRKGLGGATILWENLVLDVTTSHLTTYTFSEQENIWKRAIQAQETVDILRLVYDR